MARLALLVTLLLAAPAGAQVSLALGQTCADTLDPERACLRQEGAVKHWLDLRNALTSGMVSAGGGDCEGVSCDVVFVCDQCAVDKWLARTDIEGTDGCTGVGTHVVLSRWSVMSHRLGCLTTQIRGEALAVRAKALALERLNRAADLGSGTPEISDRRAEAKAACDAEGCG